ncbi:hypothetical protein ACWFRM_31725, partial [Streptomyces sp. NPDC055144]
MTAVVEDGSCAADPFGLPVGVQRPLEGGAQLVGFALCGSTLTGLRKGGRVGAGAPRRIAQLLAVRPDLEVGPIRGNVPPRLKKIETMGLDAVVLAVAGLRRLGLDEAIGELLPLDLYPPSPGQGAWGIQVREDNANSACSCEEPRGFTPGRNRILWWRCAASPRQRGRSARKKPGRS